MRQIAILLPFLATALPAQVPYVPGVIRRLNVPPPCRLGETHALDCTGIGLRSSVVNLAAFEGVAVWVVGNNVGGSCPVLDVTGLAILRPLSWSGDPRPGGQISLDSCPSSELFLVYFFASATTWYSPPVLLGHPIVYLGAGLGCPGPALAIPDNPALRGQTVFFQAYAAYIGPGPISASTLTNVVCVTIL